MCGMRRAQDVERACELGVDAIGFIMYPGSKRFVSLMGLQDLASRVTPFVKPILLFVDPPEQQVKEALDIVPDAILQFHGDETPQFCEQFGVPWIKAIPIVSPEDLQIAEERFEKALALLCDTPTQEHGGSGISFDWTKILPDRQKKLILAGGLRVSNIFEAVTQVRPYAVDVCSGVEVSPGVKDHRLMEEFIKEVSRADLELGDRYRYTGSFDDGI